MSTESTETNDAVLVASFNLGNAAFGIDARHVQEVTKVGDITRVHDSSAHVVGVRNLRGRIVTVIDLRVRLRLGSVVPSPENRVLIVDCQGEPIGLLVDSVTDMISVRPEDISPPPPNLNQVQGRHLKGVCEGGGRLVALLDHSALLQAEDNSAGTPSRESIAT